MTTKNNTKLRIGWLQDTPKWDGGAELGAKMIRDAAPDDVEIVDCPPGKISTDVDIYFVHNCNQYGKEIIPVLEKKPVVKVAYDIWRYGDATLRNWIAGHEAKVVLVSPQMEDIIRWQPLNVAYAPCPVDIEAFRCVRSAYPKQGVCWVGRLYPGKGVENVIEWSERNHIPVDFYGYGPLAGALGNVYQGTLRPEQVPDVMAQHESFIFLPDEYDPCTRTVIEAWAAGCKLILNGRTGATYWINKFPEALVNITGQYWDVVRSVVDGRGQDYRADANSGTN